MLVRSIHGLAQRWVVLVPAGMVIADPFTLSDPVLLPREQIISVRRHSVTSLPDDALDLRLGTLMGSVEVRLAEPAMFARRQRAETAVVESLAALISPLRAETLIAAARSHPHCRRRRLAA
ncbi:MAG: hypothetical protein M5T61_03945 [Acidimicrobiia bacterium]|nr:hypothetical protein [Acidimicrobiia bacterium]